MSAVALSAPSLLSSAVFHFTFTSRPDTGSKLIVNDTAVPSVAVAAAIERVGMSSSSVMVPIAVARVIVGSPPGSPSAFAGSESRNSKISSSSSRASSAVATVTVLVFSLAAKSSVWATVVWVKSPVEAALSSVERAVDHFTDTSFCDAPARVTVKLSAPPSVALTSATEKLGVSSTSSIRFEDVRG